MLKLKVLSKSVRIPNSRAYHSDFFKESFKDLDVLPIAIIPLIKSSTNYIMQRSAMSSNVLASKLHTIVNDSLLTRVIVDKSLQNHVQDKKGYLDFLKQSKFSIYNTITKPIDLFYNIGIPYLTTGYSRSSYDQMFIDFLAKGEYKVHQTRLYSLATMHGLLLDPSDGKILSVVTIKKEHINYYKLCLYLNEKPLTEIFEILVDSSMLAVEGKYTKLYKKFKTAVLNKCKKEGYKITIVDNLTKYLTNYKEYPKFNSIRERLNFANVVVNDDVLEHLVTNTSLLLSKQIELVG